MIAIAVALFCLPAQARVFTMKDLTFAPYIRGTFGDSWLHREPFVQEIGSADVGPTSTYEYSGELGFLINLGAFNFRLGAEILQPGIVSGNGTSPSGNQLFILNSSVFVFDPQAALEVIVKEWKSSRLLVTGGAGYATVSVTNAYTMTASGQTQYGVSSYSESLTGTAMNYFASVGCEFLFTDRLMVMFEGGYRYFLVNTLYHAQDEKTLAEPNGATKGAPALNSDGSDRHFDLSGGFVGISLRFYLQ